MNAINMVDANFACINAVYRSENMENTQFGQMLLSRIC